MGGRPRAHTPRLLPAGGTERIVGEACVCLADARARGRTARARTRAEAGARTCMLQAACGPARLCGTAARRRRAQGARHPPQKQRTRWQPASLRAARARPRQRRARPPRRMASSSPLPVVAQMVRNLAKIVPKGPRAGRYKFLPPSPNKYLFEHSVFKGKHSVLRHLAASAEVRQMLDYRTPNVGGIPGLTFNTDSNANAGKRIE